MGTVGPLGGGGSIYNPENIPTGSSTRKFGGVAPTDQDRQAAYDAVKAVEDTWREWVKAGQEASPELASKFRKALDRLNSIDPNRIEDPNKREAFLTLRRSCLAMGSLLESQIKQGLDDGSGMAMLVKTMFDGLAGGLVALGLNLL